MVRLAMVLAFVATSASAADRQDLTCPQPAAIERPAMCASPQDGIGSSLPRGALATAADADLAACRPVADKARFPAWRAQVLATCVRQRQTFRALTGQEVAE